MRKQISITIKKYKINKLIHPTALAVLYVFASLIIGEYHPFSRAEMYNSFPDSAQAICLTNNKQQYLAVTNYFDYKSADLTHNYHSLRQYLSKTNGAADSSTAIGALLWAQLSAYRNTTPLKDTLNIVEATFSMDGDSLCIKKTLLYEVVL